MALGRLSCLRTLRDPVYTKLCVVKDVDEGKYYVEKSLIVATKFQKQLFRNEITVHSLLKHRYIIKFVEKLDDMRFLMEYAINGSLENVIDSDAGEDERLKYSINFLTGLEYLHDFGYSHNDIKPSNILISKDNRAKLADFAFAGKIGETAFPDAPGSFVLGTDFFKPRKERNNFVNRPSNDIYAVGIVLYLLFSFGRAKPGKYVDLLLVNNPRVKEIVQGCLEGSVTSIREILGELEG